MIPMNFTSLTWLFAIAVTIHNIEEAIWLPKWSNSDGPWHYPVDPKVFRFAVLILTIFAYFSSILASTSEKQSVGAYLVTGYALAMLLNVIFPHLLASIMLKKYAPGLTTALILNLPITAGLIHCAVAEEYVDLKRFYYLGPIITIGILGSIPILFSLGKRIFNQEKEG